MEIEMDEFHALQRQIIDLQDCCSEWEKQALDYKAELTKTKRALDVAVNALNLYSTSSLSAMAKEVLRIIKQIIGE